MAGKDDKPLTNGDAKDVKTPLTTPAVEAEETVTLVEFRALQGVKDREVAEVQRQMRQQAEAMEALRTQMEALIEDPVKRAEFQSKRKDAQLEIYRQRDALEQQRKWFMQKYGVPADVLVDAENPADLTRRTLDWQQAQRVAKVVTPVAPSDKELKLEKLELAGGHKVSLSPGTPPEDQNLGAVEIEKQIAALRVIAQAGGNKGQQARTTILRLQAVLQRTKRIRA